MICCIIVNNLSSNLNYWSSGWSMKTIIHVNVYPITIRCYRTAFDNSNSRKNVWLPNNFMVRSFGFNLFVHTCTFDCRYIHVHVLEMKMGTTEKLPIYSFDNAQGPWIPFLCIPLICSHVKFILHILCSFYLFNIKPLNSIKLCCKKIFLLMKIYMQR